MGAIQKKSASGELAIEDESELVALARALAGSNAGYTAAELRLKSGARPSPRSIAICKGLIAVGEDPLGTAFCQLRTQIIRRESGAIYTPIAIVESMLDWASDQRTPSRIVDPGCGSGRFILSAARRFAKATLIAIDSDPLALLMLRANAAVLGLTRRLVLHCADYRVLKLPSIKGATLFIGNPPYVRHHSIGERDKAWFADTARRYGYKASKLAGLHIHFFLKTRDLARDGDFGAFITSAEWMDVNYGSVLRGLLADGLGGSGLHVIAAEALPFEAATTGAITCFKVGERGKSLLVRDVKSADRLGKLDTGRHVAWSDIQNISRWSLLIRGDRPVPGQIELGEFFRVHRGQVTGANSVWIAGNYPGVLPDEYLFPSITSADELFSAGPILASMKHLRRVVDLPVDLDALDAESRREVQRFLAWARSRGADQSFIARHRKAWWAVGLRDAAPILCTYMARRPPAFVRNRVGARHINIAHGLYPREPLSETTLLKLLEFLRSNISLESGRTYAGGLTKFEPKEVERLRIPHPDKIQ